MADVWDEYAWIVVFGCFMAFFMAYGIGANDVANAFATSVGSKTLTLFQAVILAGIFEFSGAMLLGRGVTDTIKGKIIDRGAFSDYPEVLMYGFLCALTAAGCWLLLATYLEMPVSTTHSIIGGLVGFGLVAEGKDAVNWYTYNDENDFPIEGITAVVMSWVLSPVFSGILAAFFFFIARTIILRSEHSYDRAFLFLPVLTGICVFINAFYVLDKGINKQWKFVEDHTDRSAWIAAIFAVVATIAVAVLTVILKKRLDQKASDLEKGVEKSSDEKKSSSFFSRLSDAINSNDPHKIVEEDQAVRDMHDNAELFDDRTEGVFRYLQVLTACCDSFAHGANDVANSIGPLAAIWQIYTKEKADKKAEVQEWILLIGAAGIVLGLATYGYTIIRAIGVKLAKITPSRGFSIELGSALVVVTGSYLGLPLSTTHCQVGATAAVGFMEGSKGISWKVLGVSVVGWIFTIIVVGLISAVLMALGIYTPNINMAKSISVFEGGINDQGNAFVERFADCANPALQTNLNETLGVLAGTTDKNLRYPLRAAAMLEYNTQLATEGTTVNCNAQIKPIREVYPSFVEQYPYEPEEEEEKKK